MSASNKKPLVNATNIAARKAAFENNPNKTSSASTVAPSAGQSPARSPSVRQSRVIRKPFGRTSNQFNGTEMNPDEEDNRASNAQLIAELNEQVQRAENASEQYRKQIEVLQLRLEEIVKEQTASEEMEHHRQEEVKTLRAELKDSIRQHRETEQSHESEKNMLLLERDRQAEKERELHAVIQRLNENLRSKEIQLSHKERMGKEP